MRTPAVHDDLYRLAESISDRLGDEPRKTFEARFDQALEATTLDDFTEVVEKFPRRSEIPRAIGGSPHRPHARPTLREPCSSH